MILENKIKLKSELENLKSESKLSVDILKQYKEKDRRKLVDGKLLELNIFLMNWGMKNNVINEIDLRKDTFFTENNNLIDYITNIGAGTIGVAGIGVSTMAFNIATAPVFMGLGGGIGAIGAGAAVGIASPILIASTVIYGYYHYKKNQNIKKLIQYFNDAATKIFDFYNLKLNKIKIESAVSLIENSYQLEAEIIKESNLKQIEISLEEKYKSTIALFGIYISMAKVNGKIKDEYKNYIEYIKNLYINNNPELGEILDNEITKFINMDKINLNELGFIIFKDVKINFGEIEYENCFKLLSLDYFLKKVPIEFLACDLIQYLKLNENLYTDMAIKYLDYNSCVVYYCDVEKDIIIKYKNTEKNKQHGMNVGDFSTMQEMIFEHIFKLMRKSTIEILFYGKQEYFDELVNTSKKYLDESITIIQKNNIS